MLQQELLYKKKIKIKRITLNKNPENSNSLMQMHSLIIRKKDHIKLYSQCNLLLNLLTISIRQVEIIKLY